MKLRQPVSVIKRIEFVGSLFCLVLLLLAGCGTVASLPDELARAGIDAMLGREDVDVKAAVSPGVTDDDLKKIKSIAVLIGTGNQTQINPQQPFSGMEGLTGVMADNIALELTNLGYQVIERASVDKVLSEQGLQMSGVIDTATAAEVGRIVGVDSFVLGYVTTSQEMRAGGSSLRNEFSSSTSELISNATMRIVDVEQARVLMLVTLSYKKGQKPTEAAQIMAAALAQKLKEPRTKSK
jgi:Curli production assembly/transport component CsgG.